MLKNFFFYFIVPIFILSCGENDRTSSQESAEILVPDSVFNDGVFIDHHLYGEGSYNLLFIHGWCINQTYWDEQVKFLESDYRVVTVDLPGFGRSGKNRTNWSIEKLGEDVNTVIDRLNLTNVILIGHSMGGDIALEAALKNEEVVAIVGIDNFKDVGVVYDQEVKDEINGFMEMMKNNFSEIAPAYAEGSLFHPSTDSLVKLRVMNAFGSCDSVSAIGSLESLFNYVESESNQLRRLKQKLYLINSNASPTYKSGLEETGVAFEVFEIESTGHFPMIEKPEEFNRILQQVIEKIESGNSIE